MRKGKTLGKKENKSLERALQHAFNRRRERKRKREEKGEAASSISNRRGRKKKTPVSRVAAARPRPSASQEAREGVRKGGTTRSPDMGFSLRAPHSGKRKRKEKRQSTPPSPMRRKVKKKKKKKKFFGAPADLYTAHVPRWGKIGVFLKKGKKRAVELFVARRKKTGGIPSLPFPPANSDRKDGRGGERKRAPDLCVPLSMPWRMRYGRALLMSAIAVTEERKKKKKKEGELRHKPPISSVTSTLAPVPREEGKVASISSALAASRVKNDGDVRKEKKKKKKKKKEKRLICRRIEFDLRLDRKEREGEVNRSIFFF